MDWNSPQGLGTNWWTFVNKRTYTNKVWLNLYFVKNEKFVFFHMLYVDDLLIIRNDIEKIEWIKDDALSAPWKAQMWV
jgi:hypothetical protein